MLTKRFLDLVGMALRKRGYTVISVSDPRGMH
jgi:hypothetical protein